MFCLQDLFSCICYIEFATQAGRVYQPRQIYSCRQSPNLFECSFHCWTRRRYVFVYILLLNLSQYRKKKVIESHASCCADANTSCNVIAVLQGSVIVFIEITTSEINREQIEAFAFILETKSQEELEKLVEDLSGDNVSVEEVLSVEVGASDIKDADFTVPSPVRAVEVQKTFSDCETSATVTWQAPESNGGATISKYIISCQSETASSPTGAIVDPSVSSTVIGPFQPGTFTCTVKAVNAAGSNEGIQSAPFDVG